MKPRRISMLFKATMADWLVMFLWLSTLSPRGGQTEILTFCITPKTNKVTDFNFEPQWKESKSKKAARWLWVFACFRLNCYFQCVFPFCLWPVCCHIFSPGFLRDIQVHLCLEPRSWWRFGPGSHIGRSHWAIIPDRSDQTWRWWHR